MYRYVRYEEEEVETVLVGNERADDLSFCDVRVEKSLKENDENAYK